MQYKILNFTNLLVSNICLGTAEFGISISEENAFKILDTFVEQGGNFVDTANVYGKWIKGLANCSERIIGKWIKSRNKKNTIIVATKGGHYSFNDKRISRVNKLEIGRDIKESLHTLGIDCIPFYWLHRDDLNKSIEEIIDILLYYQKEGLIRYFGLSNYKTSRLEEARKYLSKMGNNLCGVSNQWSFAEKNIVTFEDISLVKVNSQEYIWHKNTQVPLIPYSATAQGFFSKLHRAGLVVENGKIKSYGETFTQISKQTLKLYWSKENLKKYEFLINLQKSTGYNIHTLAVNQLINEQFQVVPICAAKNCNQLMEIIHSCDMRVPKYGEKEKQ